MTKLQNPKIMLKTNCFKNQNTPKISTKSDDSKSKTSGRQLGMLIMRLNNHTKNNNKYRQKPKLHKQFHDNTVFKALYLRVKRHYLQEL